MGRNGLRKTFDAVRNGKLLEYPRKYRSLVAFACLNEGGDFVKELSGNRLCSQMEHHGTQVNMSPLKEIQDLKIAKSRQLIELEARRKELFKYYYRDRSHFKPYIVIRDNGKREVEQRNFEDQKRLQSYKPVTYLLPKRLVKIQHEGPLKILAFSDYRIHDVNMLLDFVSNLGEKPDLILYAGDDIRRFTPPPLEFLKLPISSEKYPSELEAATLSILVDNGTLYLSCSSPEYGFLLRLPRHIKITPEARILSMLEFVHCLNEALKEGRLRTKRDIVTFLSQKVPIFRSN